MELKRILFHIDITPSVFYSPPRTSSKFIHFCVLVEIISNPQEKTLL